MTTENNKLTLELTITSEGGQAFYNQRADYPTDCYTAHAVDNYGREYEISWEIKEEYLDEMGNLKKDIEVEEDQLCDWDDYEAKLV